MEKTSWINPKIEIKESSVNRKGLFAKELIKNGEEVCVFGGIIIDESELDGLSKNGFNNIFDYGLEVSKGKYMYTGTDGQLEPGDFFNHSCNPNTGFKGQILLVAIKDIYPNQEITFDYAMIDSNEEDFLECSCGSENCRKTISGDDWKNPEIQIKYKGYFSQYVQSKIDLLNHKDSHQESK